MPNIMDNQSSMFRTQIVSLIDPCLRKIIAASGMAVAASEAEINLLLKRGSGS